MEKVKIWIYAEVKDNRPASVYYELLSKAAEETRGVEHAEICALVAGDSLNPVIDLLQNYSEVIVKAAETYTPDIFLFGATGRGAEIAPTVAAKLKTGLAAHGVDISIGADGTLGTSVPAFGGKVVSEILTPTHKPQMASVRLGILDNKSLSAKEHVELISLDTDILSNINSTETFVSFICVRRFPVSSLVILKTRAPNSSVYSGSFISFDSPDNSASTPQTFSADPKKHGNSFLSFTRRAASSQVSVSPSR